MLALRQLGETTVKLRGNGQLQHGIAQEFEALVVGQALPLFVAEGGVGQRLAQEIAVGKGMAEALLELIKTGTHWACLKLFICKLAS